MDSSVLGTVRKRTALKKTCAHVLGGLLALTACAGSMQAANSLLAYTYAAGTPAVSCNTATGVSTSQTIVVKASPSLAATSTVITVSFVAPGGGLVMTAPSGAQTLNSANQTTGLTFTLTAGPGCAGVVAGPNVIQFRSASASPTVAVANDNPANMNTALSSTTSALVAPAVTVTCAYNPASGGSWTPGPPQTVSVTSAAAGGTPFTVDGASLPPWLVVVSAPSGPSASTTAVKFTVQAVSPCNSTLAGTSTTSTFGLLNAPATEKNVSVTVQVLPLSPLVPSPAAPSLTYVKGSGTPGFVDVHISSASVPSPFFAVNTSTLPIWLTVDSTTGTAPASPSFKSLRFSSTNVADSLAPGTYTATVRLSVSGSADLSLAVNLLINNKAPKLTVGEGTTRNLSWTIGTPLPTPFITAVSTDSPISYTATTAGTLAPIISAAQQKGLAYSFGTQIGVTFNPLIFAAAQPGSVLTGTVTLTYGTPASTIVVTFNITVSSPGATLSGVTPAAIPTAAAGAVFSVVLTGTGFVPSTDPTLKTKVGIIPNQTGTAITFDTNIGVTVTNASNMTLLITVPAAADSLLPFSQTGVGGTVMFGICNPGGGTCSTASSTITISIGSGPIIQAVTSSSTFLQVNAPALPSIAPYDMITLWGANFCTSGGTGCGSTQVLLGTPDATSLRFPASLSLPTPVTTPPTTPDPRALTVTFLIHGGAAIQNAPLLFATNGQINVLVPAAVFTYVGSTVDIQVNWGTGAAGATPQTLFQSAKFQVNVVATDPGIFAIGADGQGQGAILGGNYALISATNPAGMRSGVDSDIVQIYVTGLGMPDTGADNASTGSFGFPADCISVASYETSLNTATGSTSWTDVDGTVIQSRLMNTGRFAPCVGVTNPISVTIGGIASPSVSFSGFVSDTVTGLYQINAQLPATTPGGSITPLTGSAVTTLVAPMQLPVIITSNGVQSQNGVTVWVAPRLAVAAPTVITGTVGLPWTTPANLVVATKGTGPYRYALTNGVLPAGLVLTASGSGSPAAGAITGIPGANTAGVYTVTVTATDSAVIPVTGSVTFTITIAGGLYMTTTSASPYSISYGAANGTLTPVIVPTGGTSPYVFTVTVSLPSLPSPAPVGMTVGATGRVAMSSVSPVPAGTYHVTVTATDSSDTPLTGSVNFDIAVSIAMANTVAVPQTAGSGLTLTTVSGISGNPSGTIIYSIDPANAAAALLFHIDSSSGALDPGTAIATGGGGIDVIVDAVDSVAKPTGAAVFGAGQKTVHVVVN